jgi:hypothetical protein
MHSQVDELRIRLEGKLEVVERAIEQHTRASEALRRADWAGDSSWWSLPLDHDETGQAVEELTRLAPDDGLLAAFERARDTLREISHERLAQLGSTEPTGAEPLAGTLRRLRGASPLVTGTTRAIDFEGQVRFHWVTQFSIALLAAVLLLFACVALPFDGWWLLTPSVIALGSPVAWSLFRRWRLRGPRFVLSAQELVLLDEPMRLPLAQVDASMFLERGRWEVRWHFAHRRSLRTSLSEAEATRLRVALGAQVRVVASSQEAYVASPYGGPQPPT